MKILILTLLLVFNCFSQSLIKNSHFENFQSFFPSFYNQKEYNFFASTFKSQLISNNELQIDSKIAKKQKINFGINNTDFSILKTNDIYVGYKKQMVDWRKIVISLGVNIGSFTQFVDLNSLIVRQTDDPILQNLESRRNNFYTNIGGSVTVKDFEIHVAYVNQFLKKNKEHILELNDWPLMFIRYTFKLNHNHNLKIGVLGQNFTKHTLKETILYSSINSKILSMNFLLNSSSQSFGIELPIFRDSERYDFFIGYNFTRYNWLLNRNLSNEIFIKVNLNKTRKNILQNDPIYSPIYY